MFYKELSSKNEDIKLKTCILNFKDRYFTEKKLSRLWEITQV